MGAAVAEAVYAIAGERNPNIFKLSCFAPLIQNLNAYRGTPFNILFTSNPDDIVLSTSYWQQLLFNHFPGSQTLPVTTAKGKLNPLFWVASIDKLRNEVYLKIVNAGNTTQPLSVELDAPISAVNGTILEPPITGDMYAYNEAYNHIILPRVIQGIETSSVNADGKATFDWTVPAFSIAVLQFDILSWEGETLAEAGTVMSGKSSTDAEAIIPEDEL